MQQRYSYSHASVDLLLRIRLGGYCRGSSRNSRRLHSWKYAITMCDKDMQWNYVLKICNKNMQRMRNKDRRYRYEIKRCRNVQWRYAKRICDKDSSVVVVFFFVFFLFVVVFFLTTSLGVLGCLGSGLGGFMIMAIPCFALLCCDSRRQAMLNCWGH